MTKHLEDIRRAHDVLHLTCDAINNADSCENCPLKKKDLCLEDTDLLTLCEDATDKVWTEFFEYSDEVQNFDDEEEESMWGDSTEDDERAAYELFMEDYYKRLPRKEINVYGHNITIIG